MSSTRPNILFVFSDQHRWCDLGCYGNTEVETPHFDVFARSAIQVNGCISNSPLCVPARGTLLTGLLPMRHGALSNDLPLREGTQSIAHVLGAAGYHTGYIGKWHLAGVPRDQYIPQGEGRFGFAEWKVCNCSHRYLQAHYYDEENRRIDIDGYEPTAQTDLATDFIRRNGMENGAAPWALVLSWGPPHDPYDQVDEAYLNRYKGRSLSLRPNVTESAIATRNKTWNRDEIAEAYRGYYAHITALDAEFGRLMAALEQTGQLENTIIVYTSDHGDMLGSQGFTNKQLPYEESIRVPLMVAWKGHTRIGTTDELIGLVDLPASLMGLAGIEVPSGMDGKDLHTLFTEPNAKGREECYSFDLIPCHQAMNRNGTEWRALRTRRFTFARSARDDGFLLFDNVRDPYQVNNLIHREEFADVKSELLSRLDRYITTYDDLLVWEEFIRKYGYLDEWNRSQAYFGLPLLADKE